MDDSLTGAQRARLRGLGQRLGAAVRVGHDGVTAAVLAELDRRLAADELVKLRFGDADRHERAALCERLAAEARCVCVGAVGRTALFYRRNPDPTQSRIAFAE